MKHSVFFDFFPPPEFLQMPSAGMDISDESIHFVEFTPTHHKESRRVKSFGERILPSGIIERGVIKKPKDLAKIIKEIKNDNRGLGFVRVSLPEEESYSVAMAIPKVDSDEIRETIQAKIEEYIPIKSEEVVFDYNVLPHQLDKSSINLEVSAVHRDIVESYTFAFEGTGITPISFEIGSRSVARSIIPFEEKGVFAVVEIKKNKTGIYLTSGGNVKMSSSVSIGVKDFKEEGDIAKNTLSHLKDEIEKRCLYWNTHKSKEKNNSDKVEGILLCGEGASIKNLSNYLRARLNKPVSAGNPWSNAVDFDAYIPPLTLNESLPYSAAIGLALIGKINNL